jgi:hypothetical protein
MGSGAKWIQAPVGIPNGVGGNGSVGYSGGSTKSEVYGGSGINGFCAGGNGGTSSLTPVLPTQAGAGASNRNAAGSNATANTGSGGGGCSTSTTTGYSGGNGGSGFIRLVWQA